MCPLAFLVLGVAFAASPQVSTLMAAPTSLEVVVDPSRSSAVVLAPGRSTLVAPSGGGGWASQPLEGAAPTHAAWTPEGVLGLTGAGELVRLRGRAWAPLEDPEHAVVRALGGAGPAGVWGGDGGVYVADREGSLHVVFEDGRSLRIAEGLPGLQAVREVVVDHQETAGDSRVGRKSFRGHRRSALAWAVTAHGELRAWMVVRRHIRVGVLGVWGPWRRREHGRDLEAAPPPGGVRPTTADRLALTATGEVVTMAARPGGGRFWERGEDPEPKLAQRRGGDLLGHPVASLLDLDFVRREGRYPQAVGLLPGGKALVVTASGGRYERGGIREYGIRHEFVVDTRADGFLSVEPAALAHEVLAVPTSTARLAVLLGAGRDALVCIDAAGAVALVETDRPARAHAALVGGDVEEARRERDQAAEEAAARRRAAEEAARARRAAEQARDARYQQDCPAGFELLLGLRRAARTLADADGFFDPISPGRIRAGIRDAARATRRAANAVLLAVRDVPACAEVRDEATRLAGGAPDDAARARKRWNP